MQRLEVSGAVRPIYGSLGVKRLKKGRFFDVFETSFPEVALEYFSYFSRMYISGSPESPS